MSRAYKVAFVGEPGAGKTTCIGAVSDAPPVTTDVPCTDALAGIKATTTVALDYGEVDLGDGERLLLYGLPGQDRFRFMFDAVCAGLLGVVLLVDGTGVDVPAQLGRVVDAHAAVLASLPSVVAFNKAAVAEPVLQACQALLRERRLVLPMVQVDARRRSDVALLLRMLLLQHEAASGTGAEAHAWT